MGIELREAMNIYPFSRARLVSGSAGMSREVVSANIQEVPGVDRWLKGGEILFTAGYAFQNAQNGCEMMERLNHVGVAALAIKPGQYLSAIPPEMVAVSNRLGLPLFELPQDLAYMDCIISIFERITQKQLEVMRRAERVHNLLTETILNKEGLDGICKILNRVTQNPVFITTPEGSVLSYKAGDVQSAQDNYIENMRGLLEEHFAMHPVDELNRNRCNAVEAGGDTKLLVVPIYVQEEHIAYLALDIGENTLVDIDAIAFEQAGSVVAIELLSEQAVWQQEQRVREQLLEDLLMKRYGNEKLVIQRGRYLGVDLNGKYCLFVINADAFEDKLKGEMSDFSEDKVQRIKAQVQQIIRDEKAMYSRPSLILDSGVGCVGLIGVRKESDVADCAKSIDSIVSKLEKIPKGMSFSAGIGRVKQGIQHVDAGRREAVLAMRAGRSMNQDGNKRTYTFGELGCLCFLSELSGSTAMRDFYRDNVQPLLDYDRANGSELEKTLEYYFINGKNLRKTAEALFVHKNSVIYRIRKIESLLGKSLDDHRAVFDLQLCFKLKSIL